MHDGCALHQVGATPGGTSAAEHCKAGLAHVEQAILISTHLRKQRVTWIPALPPAAPLLGAALAQSAFPAQLESLATWQPAAPGSAAQACWAQLRFRQGWPRCQRTSAA